jgi:hypothetical protein
MNSINGKPSHKNVSFHLYVPNLNNGGLVDFNIPPGNSRMPIIDESPPLALNKIAWHNTIKQEVTFDV